MMRVANTEIVQCGATLRRILDVDFTGGQTLLETAEQLAQRGIVFGIAEVLPDVRRELDRFGVTEKIGEDRYFGSLEDAYSAFHASS